MAVWVEVEGCCTCRMLMEYNDLVYFFFPFRNVKIITIFFFCDSDLKRNFSMHFKLCNGEGKLREMTSESKHIHSKLMQAPRTKIETFSFHLHRYTNSSEYPDHHSVLREGLKLRPDNVNWNSCITPGSEIELRPHWWEASALTIALTLLLFKVEKVEVQYSGYNCKL